MKNLKALRKARGMSQTELAELLGVTFGAVSAWELGLKYPSADKLPDIARSLQCTIDELYGSERKEAG